MTQYVNDPILTDCRFCGDESPTPECPTCRKATVGKETMMAVPPKPVYLGDAPKKCDVCRAMIVKEFADFKTVGGPWANGCLKCLKTYGVGLGTGKGQQYKLTRDPVTLNDEWVKVAG